MEIDDNLVYKFSVINNPTSVSNDDQLQVLKESQRQQMTAQMRLCCSNNICISLKQGDMVDWWVALIHNNWWECHV